MCPIKKYLMRPEIKGLENIGKLLLRSKAKNFLPKQSVELENLI